MTGHSEGANVSSVLPEWASCSWGIPVGLAEIFSGLLWSEALPTVLLLSLLSQATWSESSPFHPCSPSLDPFIDICPHKSLAGLFPSSVCFSDQDNSEACILHRIKLHHALCLWANNGRLHWLPSTPCITSLSPAHFPCTCQ